VEKNSLELARFLVEKAGAPTTGSGVTVLHHACSLGKMDIIRWLAQEANADANANVHDDNGDDFLDDDELYQSTLTTPLICASKAGHLDVVRFLVLEAKAKVDDSHNSRRLSALGFAVENGHYDVAEFLVVHAKANANAKGCCSDRQDDCSRPDVCVCDDYYAPLSMAVRAGDLNMVRLLVVQGKADANLRYEARNEWEYPHHWEVHPLIYDAIVRGHTEIAKLLLTHSNVDLTPQKPHVLFFAIQKDNEAAVRVIASLLQSKINDAREGHGRTCLHAAAEWDRPKLAKLLIEDYLADANQKDCDGNTPLQLACKMSRPKVAQLHMTTWVGPPSTLPRTVGMCIWRAVSSRN